MRCTWLAKLETISRCDARAKTSSSTGPMLRSGVTKPGTSALVESDSSRSMPASPSRAKAPRSVRTPSSGSWSILKSPVCTRVPAGVCTATASASGIEWLTETNSQWNGPATWSSPAATSTSVGSIRCSRSLAATSARVNREPTSGMSPRMPQQVGDGADVVLVPVGEDDGVDVVEPVLDHPEVGQDQVDAGLLGLGEQDAAVDDQQPAAELQHGHVAADLAEAAQRHDPQAAVGQRRRCLEVEVRLGDLRRSQRDAARGEVACAAARPARGWRRPAAAAPGRPAG